MKFLVAASVIYMRYYVPDYILEGFDVISAWGLYTGRTLHRIDSCRVGCLAPQVCTSGVKICTAGIMIGQISYGLYLWHWPVRWFVYPKNYGLPASVGGLLIVVVLSLSLTTFSYYFVEKPFLGLKKQISVLNKALRPVDGVLYL